MFSVARLSPLSAVHYHARRERLLSLLPPHSILLFPAADALLSAAGGDDIILPSHLSKTAGSLWYHFFGYEDAVLRRPLSPSAFSRCFGHTPMDIQEESLTMACFFKPATPNPLCPSTSYYYNSGSREEKSHTMKSKGRDGCVVLFVPQSTRDPQEAVWGVHPYSPETIAHTYLSTPFTASHEGSTGRALAWHPPCSPSASGPPLPLHGSGSTSREVSLEKDAAYSNALPHVVDVLMRYVRAMIHHKEHFASPFLSSSSVAAVEEDLWRIMDRHTPLPHPCGVARADGDATMKMSDMRKWLLTQQSILPQIFMMIPSQLRFGGVNPARFRVRLPQDHPPHTTTSGSPERPSVSMSFPPFRKRTNPSFGATSCSPLPFLDFYHPLQFLLATLEAIDCYKEVQVAPPLSPDASESRSSSDALVLHARYRVDAREMSGRCRSGSTRGYGGSHAVVELLSSVPLTRSPSLQGGGTVQDGKHQTRVTLQKVYPPLVVLPRSPTTSNPPETRKVEVVQAKERPPPTASSSVEELSPVAPVFSLPPLCVQDGLGAVMDRYRAVKSPCQIRQHLRSAAATAYVFFCLFTQAAQPFFPHDDPEYALAGTLDQAVLHLRAALGPRFPVDVSYIPVIASGKNSMFLHYTTNTLFRKEEDTHRCSPPSNTYRRGEQKTALPSNGSYRIARGLHRRRCGENRSIRSRSQGPSCALQEGHRVMRVDAGVSLEHVPTDCTRTFPLGRRGFQSAMRSSSTFPLVPYEALLGLQRALLKKLRVGVSLAEMDVWHMQGTQQCLQTLFCHSPPPSSPFASPLSSTPFPSREEVRNIFCPHRFGHPFGLDIHETLPSHYVYASSSSTPEKTENVNEMHATHKKGAPSRKRSLVSTTSSALLPGMVYTMEPGFYFPDAEHATMLLRRPTNESISSSTQAAQVSPVPPDPSVWLQYIPAPWRGMGLQVEDDVLVLPVAFRNDDTTTTAAPPSPLPLSYSWNPIERNTSSLMKWGNMFYWSRTAYLAAAVDAVQEQDAIVEAAEVEASGRCSHLPSSRSSRRRRRLHRVLKRSHSRFSSSSFVFSSLPFSPSSFGVKWRRQKWSIKGGGILRVVPDKVFLRWWKQDKLPCPSPPPQHNKEEMSIVRKKEKGQETLVWTSSPTPHHVEVQGREEDVLSSVTGLLRSRLPLMRAMFRVVYNQRVSMEGIEVAESHIKEDIRRIQEACAVREAWDGGASSPMTEAEKEVPLSEHFSWFPSSCKWYPYDILVLTACVPKDSCLLLQWGSGKEKESGVSERRVRQASRPCRRSRR